MAEKIKQPKDKGVCRVPVIMQLEALECGAACLAMVLAYYGKWIPLEKVRVDCGVSRDGSKAKNVLKAARNYGLDARGYRFEPEGLRESGSFPCIIHWNFNHFVVLCGFKGDKVYINDPARGNCVVSAEEFDESFTGVTLMFEPSEEFVPEGKPKSILGFAKKRLQGSRDAVIYVTLVSIISAILGLVSPVFTRVFADYLLTNENPGWISPFFKILTVFCCLQITVSLIEAFVSIKISGKLAAVGSASFMWKILHLPVHFFSQRTSGDILARKDGNGDVAMTLVSTVGPLVLNIGMMVFYLVIMIRYSVILSAIGLVSVLINAVLAGVISRKRINITRVRMRDEGKLAGATVSGIEMIETIKAGGSENGYFERWSGFAASVNAVSCKYARLEALFGILPSAVSEICDVLILGIGVYLTFSGHFTLGMIMAFQSFYQSFSSPALSLIDAGQTIQEMRTQMERVEDIMEYPSDSIFASGEKKQEENTDVKGIPSAGKLSGNIELRHVTFGYSSLEEPLIRDFNLSVKPGSRVAIVGMSGCGKSTVTKLVSGLYEPWEGEILFDGVPLGSIDKDIFSGSLAVVDQDIILFEDTIENNIKLWDNSIEDFEMIMAARDAQIHEDIVVREGGYKYRITEGGKDFSGGQRQRLEIARVLAQDPSIIILDEATSALDARTEYDVVNAIKDRGITCIVVAHRLSTIRDCDEIIVLDHGKVAERGTHAGLMALDGTYVKLVTGN